MRALHNDFLKDLRSPDRVINPVLCAVQGDQTISLEIRNNYIELYYRGGRLLEVEKRKGFYGASIDKKYFRKSNPKSLKAAMEFRKLYDSEEWVGNIPLYKQEMDIWYGKHPREEREFQQLIVRDNNFGREAKQTDYFICDQEYALEEAQCKFDMVAARWPSTGPARRRDDDIGLAILELKHGDGSIRSRSIKTRRDSSGIIKHILDIERFFSASINLTSIKEEMMKMLNQKIELGLIEMDPKKRIKSFNHDKPECIIIIANHDPAKTALKDELKGIPGKINHVDLKFATGNFMGYGLYDQAIYGFDEFMDRFSKQIYSKCN